LAQCILSLQRTPEVRPLLIKALQLREKNNGPTDVPTVRALVKLGQWDRDQSRWTDAEAELKKAVDIVRKDHSLDRPLMVECLNSYADYFNQIGKKEQADKLFAEAKAIDDPRKAKSDHV